MIDVDDFRRQIDEVFKQFELNISKLGNIVENVPLPSPFVDLWLLCGFGDVRLLWVCRQDHVSRFESGGRFREGYGDVVYFYVRFCWETSLRGQVFIFTFLAFAGGRWSLFRSCEGKRNSDALGHQVISLVVRWGGSRRIRRILFPQGCLLINYLLMFFSLINLNIWFLNIIYFLDEWIFMAFFPTHDFFVLITFFFVRICIISGFWNKILFNFA